MLSKKEFLVMKYLYIKLVGKPSLLISPEDIIKAMPEKEPLTKTELDEILKGLLLDDYIDVVNSDRKGAVIYCISLKSKGEAFNRENVAKRKNLLSRVVITIALAVLSFIITLILKAIF